MCIAPRRHLASPTPAHRETLAAIRKNNLAVKLEYAAFPAGKRSLVVAPSSSNKKSQMKRHITVQHNYHDHAADICHTNRRVPARGGVVTPFPLKLHSMLDHVEKDGLEHIVTWQPHGRCFVVHKPKEFVNILVEYFNVSKVSSFQRQLNLYGFQRLTKGKDKGGYYHELFLRGKVFLSHNIQRIKVKGTKIRARSNPAQEPDFYSMPWVVGGKPKSTTSIANTVPSQDNVLLDPLIDLSPDLMELLPNENPLEQIPASMWDEDEEPIIFSNEEVDGFLEGLDFPTDDQDLANIENDDIFGSLLEKMIA